MNPALPVNDVDLFQWRLSRELVKAIECLPIPLVKICTHILVSKANICLQLKVRISRLHLYLFYLFSLFVVSASSFQSPRSPVFSVTLSPSCIFVKHHSTSVSVFLFSVSTNFLVLITTYSSVFLSTCPDHIVWLLSLSNLCLPQLFLHTLFHTSTHVI